MSDPNLAPRPRASAADVEECRRWTAHHSKSFYLSSLLLPRLAREEAWALYAFCRRADDAVDEGPQEASAQRRRIDGLRMRLDRVYRGDMDGADAIDRAFAVMVRRTGLPRGAPEALLAGMQMDTDQAIWADDADLLTYCFRVASVVGLMMVAILGHTARAEQTGHVMLRAADLGVGMQLTNIARDVGEDARRGRVYLPRTLLAQHGTSPEEVLDLAARGAPPSEGIRRAVQALLDRADAHYRAADRGIPALPGSCRLAIRSARYIYAAIGDRVAARGFDSMTTRAVVSTGAKLLLVLRALLPGRPGPLETPGPADAPLAALIHAAGLPAPAALLTPPAPPGTPR